MNNASFKRWVAIAITTSLILVFAVGLSSYLSFKNLIENQKWVNHTENIISKTNNTLGLIADAETGQRGFLLSNDEKFLDPYNKAIPKIDSNIDALELLVIDNPYQVKNVELLKFLVNDRLAILKNVIAAKRSGKIKDQTSLVILLESGLSKMINLRAAVKKIIDRENSLLNKRKLESERSINNSELVIIIGTIIIFIVIIVLYQFIQTSFKNQIKAQGELELSNNDLKTLFAQNEEKTWILKGSSDLSNDIQGDLSVNEMAEKIIKSVSSYVGAQIGAIYLANETEDQFELMAGYALSTNASKKRIYKLNESWIGQAAADRKPIIVKGDLNKNLEITSGLILSTPVECKIIPFFFNDAIKGLLELGFSEKITSKQKDFLNIAAQSIGVAVNTVQSKELLQKLFEETQMQAEELESQQEELRVANEELILKTQMLESSEEELRQQQEELQEINAELEVKAHVLETKNQVIENAKETIFLKMKQVEQSNKYKSEFLANMSHELRTPLNSILILARILKDNKSNNLSEEESKFANVIFKAGNDLLNLINDILDLAKIESGKIDLNYEEVSLDFIADDLRQLFAQLAKNKEVNYLVSLQESLPKVIQTDKTRLEQILKNLLSNAFKFTPKGGEVKVEFSLQGTDLIRIDVIDSGIGIAEEKQKIIFEAFQQADGSTSREYGGTGLGLSICKELSNRMGGKIELKSVPNQGSTFSLIVPIEENKDNSSDVEASEIQTSEEQQSAPEILKKLSLTKITHPKRVKPLLLIVEDDQNFNDYLKKYGIDKNFDVLQAYDGEQALNLAFAELPDAILLDVMLPGIDGWNVLKRLKSDDETSAIPVHMMSAGDQREQKAIISGALSFIKKPVDNDVLENVFSSILNKGDLLLKSILLVEDHEIQSDALAKLFQDKGIDVKQAYSGEEALKLLEDHSFDCIILDLKLPDISGIDLLEKIKSDEKFKNLPVVVNTEMELDDEKITKLLNFSNATVMKSSKSSDRLLDEVSLFLHKIKSDELKPLNKHSQESTDQLRGKTILLVDDDMRNIFALSAVLDGFGFKVEIANDGEEAIEKLKTLKAVNLVLMDIMMPKMNGFEAMRVIRTNNKWKKLPIIALTAKAMKEDRADCIAAGANDYITKPVDVDKLLSLIKIWLA